MREYDFSVRSTNGIKGIAILFMMYHHCFATKDRFEGYVVDFFPLSTKFGVMLSLSMKICVGMFVFLSAYGITVSMKRKNENYAFAPVEQAEMTLRRLIRMMSGYMFLFVVVQILSPLLGHNRFTEVYGYGREAVVGVVIDFFGLSDLFGTPTYLATWWYMSVAVLLVLLMPVFIALYKKAGWGAAILCAALFPFVIQIRYGNMERYLLVMMLGVVFADRDCLARLASWTAGGHAVAAKAGKFLVETGLIVFLFACRNSKWAWTLVDFWDSLIPVVIIAFSFEFILVIPGLRNGLEFIGKYSMNIFLAHNFFRVFWCPDFIYGFHSAWLIPLVLLGISLLFSVALELLKKGIRFDRFTDWLNRKISGVLKLAWPAQNPPVS